jgi:hypothetical protein
MRFFQAALLLAALASCASVVSYPERTRVPADLAGAAHAGDPVMADENALMDRLGIVWVRNDFYWNRVEPRRGEWDFSRYDKMVEENKKSGRKILATLAFDNNWLYKNGKRRDYVSSEHLPLYLEYVEKVVTRYKGKVDAWEIWNEPNVPIRFWNGPPKDFFALSAAAAKKIKQCDSGAYVIAGAFFRLPVSFIKAMHRAGALENVDALSVHPYASTPGAVVRLYDKFEKLTRGLGFAGDLWVTEIGYPVAGFYPMTIPEKRLGDYIVKTMTLLAARGARVVVWYQLSESYLQGYAPAPVNSERFFGLAYKDFQLRSGAGAFADIVGAIAGGEYLRDVPDAAGGGGRGAESFYFKKANGSMVRVYWDKKNPAKIETVPARP